MSESDRPPSSGQSPSGQSPADRTLLGVAPPKLESSPEVAERHRSPVFVRSGTSVVMAPEGTRSLTPKLGRFKKGGFHMAVQAGVPIVPVVIRNAGEIMWRGAKTARTGTIQVVVHPPVPTAGWTIADIDRARDEMQQLYQDTLDDWPGTAGATGTVAAVTR